MGVEERDEALVKAWLDQYHLLNIDKAIADLAATLRRQYGWKLPDAFQGAILLFIIKSNSLLEIPGILIPGVMRLWKFLTRYNP